MVAVESRHGMEPGSQELHCTICAVSSMRSMGFWPAAAGRALVIDGVNMVGAASSANDSTLVQQAIGDQHLSTCKPANQR